ncbi:MAG: 4-hydroxythreonine-4-phosphate dehydrogenase PdxA [Pseudomonadota bacterium]
MSNSPLIVTMGDPSGIGPEIVVKALKKETDCVVAGSAEVIERAVAALGLEISVKRIETIEDAEGSAGVLQVLETSKGNCTYPIGKVSAASGKAAFDAIVAATKLARSGRTKCIVTAPIHKEALAAAGINFTGHTEMLAEFGGAERVAMMLANEDIRTVLVTIHCCLAEAVRRGDHSAQMSAIRLAHEGCVALGIDAPRVAVAGLNPHAGESGLFGREEIDIIAPAIAAARAEGVDASGPWPGDTVFMAARKGKFDVVVAQYHDQGLIPVKYLGVEKGVNITLGLPFVRTSPDHGTAFDIAGKGIADAASLSTAIDYARRLAATRSKTLGAS